MRCPETHLIGLPLASRSTTYWMNFNDQRGKKSPAPHRLNLHIYEGFAFLIETPGAWLEVRCS